MSKNFRFSGVSVARLGIRIQDFLGDLERGDIKSKSDFSDKVLEAMREETIGLVDAVPSNRERMHLDTFETGVRVTKEHVEELIREFLV